jgi:hypothetical protein
MELRGLTDEIYISLSLIGLHNLKTNALHITSKIPVIFAKDIRKYLSMKGSLFRVLSTTMNIWDSWHETEVSFAEATTHLRLTMVVVKRVKCHNDYLH